MIFLDENIEIFYLKEIRSEIRDKGLGMDSGSKAKKEDRGS